MTTPIRHWPESEIETLTSMPRVVTVDQPPPKRRTMEQDPIVKRPPSREEVEAIEDQILRMAFKKAMKTIRFRTLITTFLAGLIAGFVALGVTLAAVITRAGG